MLLLTYSFRPVQPLPLPSIFIPLHPTCPTPSHTTSPSRSTPTPLTCETYVYPVPGYHSSSPARGMGPPASGVLPRMAGGSGTSSSEWKVRRRDLLAVRGCSGQTARVSDANILFTTSAESDLRVSFRCNRCHLVRMSADAMMDSFPPRRII
jgi:hypothetical protein